MEYKRQNGNDSSNISNDQKYIDTVYGRRHCSKVITKSLTVINPYNDKPCQIKFEIQAIPLVSKIIKFIENDKHQEIIDYVNKYLHNKREDISNSNEMNDEIKTFFSNLGSTFKSKKFGLRSKKYKNVLSFGPKLKGCNILISNDSEYDQYTIYHQIFDESKDDTPVTHEDLKNVIINALISSFQFVTQSGPVCNEELYGTCIIVDKINIIELDNSDEINRSLIPLSEQINAVLKTGFKESILCKSIRIVQPLYRVFIQGDSDVLGSIYDVILKRKGKITGDNIVVGTKLFDIYGYLPVFESFGFSDELRSETAGNVVPSLKFSHWEVIDIFVNKDDILNDALYYNPDEQETYSYQIIKSVRKRKGLQIQEQIVKDANKQSTRSRKK